MPLCQATSGSRSLLRLRLDPGGFLAACGIARCDAKAGRESLDACLHMSWQSPTAVGVRDKDVGPFR